LAQIANGMAKLAWKKPMIGSWTLSMASFIDTAGKNGNGATMPQTYIQTPSTTAKRKAFQEAYLKEFKPKNNNIASPVSAAQGYDSVYLLAAAIKQANSTEGPKIVAALQDLKTPVDGVVITYNKPFSATDHDAIKMKDVVMGVVENGRVEFLNAEDATPKKK
jgi:branched-chain amino acid transport system substrate-binding protein